jgi:predicted RNase H-like nuclease (RuvC/YqgF family)
VDYLRDHRRTVQSTNGNPNNQKQDQGTSRESMKAYEITPEMRIIQQQKQEIRELRQIIHELQHDINKYKSLINKLKNKKNNL